MIKRTDLGILSLILLVRNGVPTPYLLRIFLAIIRRLVDYVSLVRHYGLISDQRDLLKTIQYQTLQVVSKSPKVLYCFLLKQFCLTTIMAQRGELCFKFAAGILTNPRLHGFAINGFETIVCIPC